MPPPVLSCEAVVRARGLDVGFAVAGDEVVALLGPNGAGKSTLLAVIAGLLRPDTGRVVLDGRVLTEVTGGAPTARTLVPAYDRGTTLLTQDPLLFPHLTVLDNVAFGPRSRRASRGAARDSAREWLATVGAADLADRRPGSLSGGQAQRVAVARALATHPRLLLLDEPTAALDVAVAAALRLTLRPLLRRTPTVLVTHDVLDALLLADRVLVLDGGRIVEDGPTAQVLTRPRSRFAARLAGLNMITGRWRGGGVDTASGRLEGRPVEPLPRDGDLVVAVFRPAAVAVYRSAPGGSPRNTLPVQVTDLESHGDQVRVHAGELSAEVTASATTELDLQPGARVVFTVKASEVDVYAT